MSSYDKEGKVVLGDPLQWWRVKAREYPMLAALARRMLCIPASQAHPRTCVFGGTSRNPDTFS
ncbi:unnamed protein product, partial [Ectocarpus sp. 12 AP-2014]